jgi:hypothetical protein
LLQDKAFCSFRTSTRACCEGYSKGLEELRQAILQDGLQELSQQNILIGYGPRVGPNHVNLKRVINGTALS